MRHLLSLGIMLLFGLTAHAALVTESVSYMHGETRLEGYLAYNDAIEGKRPGVLVVHEWWGLNDYAKSRARKLALAGYIAFAVDMYGEGMVASNANEARQLAAALREHPTRMRARVKAGLAALRGQPLCDETRTAAIGYCFGGGVVLELARSGADVAGVASFHGNLVSPHPDGNQPITAKVLVVHGADDPFVTARQIADFQDEMTQADADWQMIVYGHAVHTFTNPDAGDDPKRGSAYNEAADRRSWKALKAFLREVFREP